MTVSTDQFIEEKMRGKSPQERADALLEFYRDLVKVNPPQETVTVLASLYRDLPKKQQEEFAQAVLGPPSDGTRDWIWVIIVGAFALVLLGSAAVLGWAVFAETKANVTYFAKIETVVTVFTSVLAFLSGLLAPSPVKK
jgi:hypothetical protein